jgi:hypothetical protein
LVLIHKTGLIFDFSIDVQEQAAEVAGCHAAKVLEERKEKGQVSVFRRRKEKARAERKGERKEKGQVSVFRRAERKGSGFCFP